MKNKILQYLRSFDSKPQQKIFLLILFPALLGVLFAFISLFSFRSTYMETLKSTHASMLQNFSKSEEQTISEIAYSIRILSDDELFYNTVSGTKPTAQSILHTQSVMNKISMNYKIIDSIVIADRTNSKVYTTKNTYDFKEYFSEQYKYENYSVNYWSGYQMPVSEKYTLPPTTVSTQHGQKKIIPLLFTRVGSRHISNIIVINLDLSQILTDFSSCSIFNNSIPSILNKKTHQLFSENMPLTRVDDEKLISQLTNENLSCFDYSMYDKKSLIVSYSPSYSSLGYVYLITTPYGSISNSVPKSLNILFILNTMIFVFILLLSFREAKMVYSPFKKIAGLFPNKKDGNLEDLHNIISNMISSNQHLEHQLEHTLPLIEEQKLVRLLNSAEHYNDIEHSVSDDFSGFVNDWFCSVIIRLSPTQSFYEKYDSITEKNIELGIYNLVKAEFSEKFEHMYVIPSNEHTLYILLNPDTRDSDVSISETIAQLESAFSYDSTDLTVSIVAGSVQIGLNGLKQSHNEAMNKLSSSNLFKHIHIQIDETHAPKPLFSFADETALYNHLITSNTDKAVRLMQEKIPENAHPDELKQLYTQYLNLIFRVMRLKNIDYDIEKRGDSALIDSVLSTTTQDIWSSINTLMNTIKQQNNAKKVDINNVIQHIQDNYNTELYLEDIAKQFNTSASYLSRLIKKETSVSFSEYINLLRINKAKELLNTTDMTIKEIYEAVGFNNRNTFIRIFKSSVGTTPSDFKKNYRGGGVKSL